MPDEPELAFNELVQCWTVRSDATSVTRLSSDREHLPKAPASARQDAVSVIIQLEDFRLHKLWRNGRLLFEGGHPKGAIAISDLREEWQCHHLSPFDNIRFNIPLVFIRSFLLDLGRPQFDGFDCPPGTKDEVVLGIGQAVLPYLVDNHEPNPLFFEQISLVLLTHLLHTYGNQNYLQKRNSLLAPWQQKRALEYLTTLAFDQVSVGEIAEACGLSRNYFIRAFKDTLGKTPYRWVTEYRIAKVKEMLLTELPMLEVVAHCGFADQSHLTRVFRSITGETPGKWRRRNRTSNDLR